MHYDFDWPGAEREFRRALELNPNYATAHQWYAGSYLALLERSTEAVAEMNKALALDPMSPVINVGLGRCYYCARQYDLAIEQYNKTLEIDPSYPSAHLFLGRAYAQAGWYDRALAELGKANWHTFEAKAVSGYVYAVSGQRGAGDAGPRRAASTGSAPALSSDRLAEQVRERSLSPRRERPLSAYLLETVPSSVRIAAAKQSTPITVIRNWVNELKK